MLRCLERGKNVLIISDRRDVLDHLHSILKNSALVRGPEYVWWKKLVEGRYRYVLIDEVERRSRGFVEWVMRRYRVVGRSSRYVSGFDCVVRVKSDVLKSLSGLPLAYRILGLIYSKGNEERAEEFRDAYYKGVVLIERKRIIGFLAFLFSSLRYLFLFFGKISISYLFGFLGFALLGMYVLLK